ncbi:MAG: hypothetical protein Q8L71_11930 [Thiobacillus sp.]|nr:hypothetical protein [Thiobacillus sp.]
MPTTSETAHCLVLIFAEINWQVCGVEFPKSRRTPYPDWLCARFKGLHFHQRKAIEF